MEILTVFCNFEKPNLPELEKEISVTALDDHFSKVSMEYIFHQKHLVTNNFEPSIIKLAMFSISILYSEYQPF